MANSTAPRVDRTRYRCPDCAYDLSASLRESDGVIVCSECGERWLEHELVTPKRPRRDKYSGAVSFFLLTPWLLIIWTAWFVGDPYSWLSLAYMLLVVSLLLFIASSLWEVGIRLASHPSRCGRVAIPRVLGPYLVWNILPVIGWLVTFRFWMECIAAV